MSRSWCIIDNSRYAMGSPPVSFARPAMCASRQPAHFFVRLACSRAVTSLLRRAAAPALVLLTGACAISTQREIELGASPRAGLALDRCGRAHAWLRGQDFVSPADIQAIAPDVLRHRIGLSYEATGAGRDADAVLADLLALVAVG